MWLTTQQNLMELYRAGLLPTICVHSVCVLKSSDVRRCPRTDYTVRQKCPRTVFDTREAGTRTPEQLTGARVRHLRLLYPHLEGPRVKHALSMLSLMCSFSVWRRSSRADTLSLVSADVMPSWSQNWKAQRQILPVEYCVLLKFISDRYFKLILPSFQQV